jgi:hypothetical protein
MPGEAEAVGLARVKVLGRTVAIEHHLRRRRHSLSLLVTQWIT